MFCTKQNMVLVMSLVPRRATEVVMEEVPGTSDVVLVMSLVPEEVPGTGTSDITST